MTETGHGSDVQSLGTTATYDPATDELVVHTPDLRARKDYIGGAARDGRMAAVFAQLVTEGESHGVHCVLVPIRDESGAAMPGVTIGDCGAKAGLPGVDNGRLVVRPRARAADQPAQPLRRHRRATAPTPRPSTTRPGASSPCSGTLVRGRISVAGGAGAATRTALTLAITYAGHRRQFAPPGGTRRGDPARLPRAPAQAAARARQVLRACSSPRTSWSALMHDVQSAGEPPTTTSSASSRHGRRASRRSRRPTPRRRSRCAGRPAAAPATSRSTDCPPSRPTPTSSPPSRATTPSCCSSSPRGCSPTTATRSATSTPWAWCGSGRGSSPATVIERTSARGLIQRLIDSAPGRDSEKGPTDRGWQLDLFEDREKHLLETLALRLRKAGKPGADAVRRLQRRPGPRDRRRPAPTSTAPSSSRSSRPSTGCDDPSAAQTLSRVCDLYALSSIEADKGWFLEHGRITPARSKQVTAAVNDLCAALRPHAQELVDAFGIPKAWLGTELLTPLA